MARVDLTIELERPDGPHVAGREVRARVVARVHAETECRALTVGIEWQAHGRGDFERGASRPLHVFAGRWTEGEHAYEVALRAPTDPVPFRGELLHLGLWLVATAEGPWREPLKAEEALPVTHRPAGLVIDGVDTGVVRWGGAGLGCSALLVGAGLASAVAAARDYIGVAWPVATLIVAALLLFTSAPRFLAERKLGGVRVKLAQRRSGSYREAEQDDRLVCEVRVAKPPRGSTARLTLEVREQTQRATPSGRTVEQHSHFVAEVPLSEAEPGVFQGILGLPEAGSVPYSFEGRSNAVRWEATVRLSAPGMPAWSETFALKARPTNVAASP